MKSPRLNFRKWTPWFIWETVTVFASAFTLPACVARATQGAEQHTLTRQSPFQNFVLFSPIIAEINHFPSLFPPPPVNDIKHVLVPHIIFLSPDFRQLGRHGKVHQ